MGFDFVLIAAFQGMLNLFLSQSPLLLLEPKGKERKRSKKQQRNENRKGEAMGQKRNTAEVRGT